MNQFAYFWPALACQLAVLMAFVSLYLVGQARGRYSVPPPFTDGPEDFMRRHRAQVNTIEHMVIFLPSLWMFSLYVSSFWGGMLGLLWVVGRTIYLIGYYRSVKGRIPGFLIALLPLVILSVGSLIGIIYSWVTLT